MNRQRTGDIFHRESPNRLSTVRIYLISGRKASLDLKKKKGKQPHISWRIIAYPSACYLFYASLTSTKNIIPLTFHSRTLVSYIHYYKPSKRKSFLWCWQTVNVGWFGLVVSALGHPPSAHPSTSGSLFWDSCRDPQTIYQRACPQGYNEFDFFLEILEHRPFDGCKILI